MILKIYKPVSYNHKKFCWSLDIKILFVFVRNSWIFCCVCLDPGEVFLISIFVNFVITFQFKHCLLKYMWALHFCVLCFKFLHLLMMRTGRAVKCFVKITPICYIILNIYKRIPANHKKLFYWFLITNLEARKTHVNISLGIKYFRYIPRFWFQIFFALVGI